MSIITAYDGYIEINGNSWTWVGTWANSVRTMFYKTCRLAKIEPNNQALAEFLSKVIHIGGEL